MKFALDENEILVQDSARKFLASLTDIEQKLAREAEAAGFVLDEWAKLADLGWLALGGDIEGELHVLCILAMEIGRAAFAAPFMATAGANLLLSAAGDARPADLGATVGRGEKILAYVDPAQDDSLLTAIRVGGELRLNAGRMIVDWLPAVDAVVVAVMVDGQPGVALLGKEGLGVICTPCQTFDNGRAGFLSLAGATPDWWAPVDGDRLGEALKGARLLGAAEAVGGAQGAIRLTADYVNERQQFGAPISSFQAVRHGLADAEVLVEGAWLAVWDGIGRATKGEPIEGRAALATWLAKRAFQDAVIKGAQYHGGMGHVVDSHMQFFYRRAGTFHGRSIRDWNLLREVANYYVEPHFPQGRAA